MRADLPPAVVRAIASATGPTLVFDRERLAANLATVAAAARDHAITAVFAAKSFPHADVWALAAEHLAGFDAASAGEVAALHALSPRVLSVVDPTGQGGATARAPRVIIGCETVQQVERAPATAEIAIRISASLTGRDPAIGALQDGSGHRRSRFGLDGDPRTELAALVRAAGARRVGLHVHHGPVTPTSAERFLVSARAVLAAAEGICEPAFLDVGGAWHAITDLAAAFAQLRAGIPAAIELLVEPGRAITREAGFACGRVVVARDLADRSVRVVDLSRSCHLRWAQVELVGSAPHAGTGRAITVVGPTCYEDDVIGEWTVPPDALAEGDRVILRNVSGYAVAWNTGFGGVPPATVVIA